MNTLFKAAAASLAIAGGAVGPALAHHSFAMFDQRRSLAVDVVVVELQWTTPHSWLEVTVPDGTGAHNGHQRLSLEMGSLSGLKRTGWKPTTVKAGDRIKLNYHPMRNGSAAGQLIDVTLADGAKLRG